MVAVARWFASVSTFLLCAVILAVVFGMMSRLMIEAVWSHRTDGLDGCFNLDLARLLKFEVQ